MPILLKYGQHKFAYDEDYQGWLNEPDFRRIVAAFHNEVTVVNKNMKKEITVEVEFPSFPKHVKDVAPPVIMLHCCPARMAKCLKDGQHISDKVCVNGRVWALTWEYKKKFVSAEVYDRSIRFNSVPCPMPYGTDARDGERDLFYEDDASYEKVLEARRQKEEILFRLGSIVSLSSVAVRKQVENRHGKIPDNAVDQLHHHPERFHNKGYATGT